MKKRNPAIILNDIKKLYEELLIAEGFESDAALNATQVQPQIFCPQTKTWNDAIELNLGMSDVECLISTLRNEGKSYAYISRETKSKFPNDVTKQYSKSGVEKVVKRLRARNEK